MCDNCNHEEEMTEEKARKMFSIFRVHAPTLDDELRPLIQLCDKSECPLKSDGICCKCEKFRGLISEDGTIFAYSTFEGFCDTKDKEGLLIEGKKW